MFPSFSFPLSWRWKFWVCSREKLLYVSADVKKCCQAFHTTLRFAAWCYGYFKGRRGLFVWSSFGLKNAQQQQQQRLDFPRPVGGAVAMLPAEESWGKEATTSPEQVQFWLKMSFWLVLFVSIRSGEDKRIRNILL